MLRTTCDITCVCRCVIPFPILLRHQTLIPACLCLGCNSSRVRTSTTREGSRTSRSREGRRCRLEDRRGVTRALSGTRSFCSSRELFRPYLFSVNIYLPVCTYVCTCLHINLHHVCVSVCLCVLGSGPSFRWQRSSIVLMKSPLPIVCTV